MVVVLSFFLGILAVVLITMCALSGPKELRYSILGVSFAVLVLAAGPLFGLFPESLYAAIFTIWCGLALESVILLFIAIKEKSKLDVTISGAFLILNFVVSRLMMI